VVGIKPVSSFSSLSAPASGVSCESCSFPAMEEGISVLRRFRRLLTSYRSASCNIKVSPVSGFVVVTSILATETRRVNSSLKQII